MYNFQLSRSHRAYLQKPSRQDCKNMIFSKRDYTIESFIDDVKRGYSFAYCFNYNHPFTTHQKTNIAFSSTKIIAFDMDDNAIPMLEEIDRLRIKPTIAYTTPQDKLLRDPKTDAILYRFRMIYCFNEDIIGEDEYREVYSKLLSLNNIRKIKDNCMKTPCQLFNGNADKSIEIYKSDVIYDLKTIYNFKQEQESINENNIKKNNNQINSTDTNTTKSINENNIKKTNRQINLNDTNVPMFSNQFIVDFYKLNRREFLLKYIHYCFDVKYESDLIEVDCRYSVYPYDYVKIPIKYAYQYNINKQKKTKMIARYKDGERRHKYIHLAGLIFKKLNPSITHEQMLWLLVFEIFTKYDNFDNKFNEEYMIKLTKQVMQEPLLQIVGSRLYKLPMFRVNKDFCTATMQTTRSVCNQINRELRYREYDQYYDPSKTQKDNLEIMQQHNVKISIATLKRYVKYKKEKHCSVDDPHYIFEMTKLPLLNKNKKSKSR